MFAILTADGPLAVDAGGTSPELPFPELASDGDGTIHLRLVAHGEAPGAPAVTLHTDLTAPAVLTDEFAALTTADGTSIADAGISADTDGTHRIRIFTHQLGTRWSLTITNPDTVTRTYLVVVADDRDQARQPWIDAPAELHFEAGVGVALLRPLPVRNLGTGDLRLAEPPGISTGPFDLAIPAPIRPNGRGDLVVTCTPPAVGESTSILNIASNDPAPTGQPGHNQRVSLRTRTRWLPPGTILLLVTAEDGATLLRVDPDTGRRTPISRFSRLAEGQPIVYDLSVEADGQVLVLRPDVPGVAADGFRHSWCAIDRVHPVTGEVATLVVGFPLEGFVRGAVDRDGQAIVAAHDAQPFGGAVLRVDLARGETSVLAPADWGVGEEPTFVLPHDAAVATDGTLFVIARGPESTGVFRVDRDTGEAIPAFPALARRASSLVADARGGLVVTAPDGEIVRIAGPDDATPATLVPAPNAVSAVAVDADDRVVLVENGSIVRLDPATGDRTLLSPAPLVPEGQDVPVTTAIGVVR